MISGSRCEICAPKRFFFPAKLKLDTTVHKNLATSVHIKADHIRGIGEIIELHSEHCAVR